MLDPADGKSRAWLAAHGRIVAESLSPDGFIHLTLEMPAKDIDQAVKLGLTPRSLAAE
jgi:hypothetical protein